MTKSCLITGATGMAGSAMIEYILENHHDYKILACRRRHSDMSNVLHLLDNKLVEWIHLDLTDTLEVEKTIEWFLPNKIFHLGAQSFVPRSWKAPIETINVNVLGSVNLFESVRKYTPESTIHVAGSSEEYGLVYPHETPIKETNPLRPLSPYACSKVMLENLSYTYFKSYGTKVVITRAFNHTGIYRGEEFVTAQICKQAAEIALGERESFYLGNLDAQRDFTDVRDTVRAYWEASEKCNYGEPYNICSGKSHSIKQLVDIVSNIAQISNEVKQNPEKMRPADVPILLGDNSKLKEKTSWSQIYDFESDTLGGIFQHWYEKLSKHPMEKMFL